jgi:hypothetical protein
MNVGRHAVLGTLVLILSPGLTASAQTEKPSRVERAVDDALAFLKTMQERDGSWSAQDSRNPAVTSLAVLAFLSAGHVPGEGPYGKTVEAGVRWVLQCQQGKQPGPIVGQDMYHHGICALMLAQVAGMTIDEDLTRQVKSSVEKGVSLLLKAQRTTGLSRGGWRYNIVGTDADLSVTGWQLLALRAARNVGCDVPAERIDLAVDFVLRCQEPRKGFAYMPGGGMTIPCTGTGILCLEVCGKERHRSREALQAAAVILRQPPATGRGHFFYATYYCSQAMFQLGGNYWDYFRPLLHKVLLDGQQDNGCWLHGDGFGPNYATAMAVLALTVEHRFLPIYQRGEDSPGQK